MEEIITDENFNLESKEMINPYHRYGARGIIINDNNEIAVFHKKNKNEYKLPGGGIENGESKETGFLREVLEETGCVVEVIDYLGTVEERRSHDNFIQTSYVFVGKVIEDTNKLSLTKKESDEGGCIVWCKADMAYQLIKDCINNMVASDYENLYHSNFMNLRDVMIMKEYLNKKY